VLAGRPAVLGRENPAVYFDRDFAVREREVKPPFSLRVETVLTLGGELHCREVSRERAFEARRRSSARRCFVVSVSARRGYAV
jgi:hypothetical protein